MLKTFIAALAATFIVVSTPASAGNNSEELAIGIGAFIGGMIIGGAIDNHHHHYRPPRPPRYYEYYEEPVYVYRPRKRCLNEIVGYYHNEPIIERVCRWK